MPFSPPYLSAMKFSTAIATLSMMSCLSGATIMARTTPIVPTDLSKDLEYSPYANRSPAAIRVLETSRSSPHVRTVVVVEDGRVVVSYVRDDVDPNEPYDVWSVTKGVTSLLMGILLESGAIESVDETLGRIFADETTWEGIEDAEYRKNITIRELLTMTSGLAWDWSRFPLDPDWFEGVCSSERGNDQLRRWLSGPEIGTKGKFDYLGYSDILSHVIVKRTGMTPRDFIAKRVLPHLGIKADEIGWGAHCASPANRSPSTDEPESAFHNLRLTPVQMAKFGMLFLQEGAAGSDVVVVSSAWVREMFTPFLVIKEPSFYNTTGLHSEVSYGYLWYKDLAGIGTDNWCAFGMGGQYICIDRDLGRVLILQRDCDLSDPDMDLMDLMNVLKVTLTDFVALDPNLSFKIQMPDDGEL